MLSEISVALSEIEHSTEYIVMNDIGKAYSDLKSVCDNGKISNISYMATKYELDDLSEQLARGWMSVNNEYDVESIYAAIGRVYLTINHVEYMGNPLEQLVHTLTPPEVEIAMAVNSAKAKRELDNKATQVPAVKDDIIPKIFTIDTPEPTYESDEDGIHVIVSKKDPRYKPRPNKPKPVVAEVSRSYEVSHSETIPKEVFFHNITMAIQRFCGNYSCTFDGYTMKYAYCNINITHMVREVGSNKLKYRPQVGVVFIEYKYTSKDLKNNAKEVNDAVGLALNELYNGLNMYAACNYVCPY